jgi:hypothetical protein
MVSIAAFQAVDPGSIPGHRIIFCSKKHFQFIYITVELLVLTDGQYRGARYLTGENLIVVKG